MRKPQAIIFDLDGTLIHSAPDLQAAMNAALTKIGRDPLDLATIIGFIGNGVEKLVWRSLDATGGVDDELFAKSLGLFLDAYERDMVTLTRPYPGVMHCLAQLRAAGVAMAVCTNKPETPARSICDAIGLTPFFDVIAGARPGHPKKPDPEPLHGVARALGIETSRAIYVGDSAVDFQTAAAADMAFRLFDGGYLNTALPSVPKEHRFEDWSKVTFRL